MPGIQKLVKTGLIYQAVGHIFFFVEFYTELFSIIG